MTHALYSVGFTLTEHNPDYVVVGETRSYDYEKIERAVRLIVKGARFIATNLDLTGRIGTGHPAGLRGLGGADRAGYRPQAVLRRQAERR